MDTTGEPSAKRFKNRTSSAAQTKLEHRNEWYVRLRLRGQPKIMELQVAALIQQLMEMNERMRQSEEQAEQARQLLDAPRTAGQNE